MTQTFTVSNEMKAQTAAKMVILDAIEKGHTNPSELAEYMKSETFATACTSYMAMM